jgi:outer membrane receptor protein involved in Fe transport
MGDFSIFINGSHSAATLSDFPLLVLTMRSLPLNRKVLPSPIMQSFAYPAKRTLMAVAIAHIFAAVAVAGDDATAPSADPAPSGPAPIQTVTIASQRTPRTAARLEQENAPNLVNVTTADEISKLPDVNAAEAVRRLPGISLETDTGEGRFINIRGLDAEKKRRPTR